MPIFSELTAAAVVALLALLGGVAMARLKQSPVLGYILAGVLLGPSGLGLVQDHDWLDTLAEFGLLLLLFVVGIELDVRRFVSAWRVTVTTTCVQIAGSLGVALLVRPLLGWSFGLAVMLGFAVAVSSTAVVIKMLESIDELSSPAGRLSVGILVAQDIAVVPMMLVLGALGTKGGLPPMVVGKVLASVVFLVALLAVLARRRISLPFGTLLTDSHDLSPLSGLAFCFGAASLSGLLDLSPAYGAFLAGVVIGNSVQREKMLHSARPIQAVLLMVFFLSVGLMLDLGFIWKHLGTVLTLLAMVTVFKTALNVGTLKLLRQTWPVAVLAGGSLAQIGEFSFVLAETGRAAKLITSQELRLVAAVTVLSLILSPLWLMTARRLHPLAESGITTLGALFDAIYGREWAAVRHWFRRRGAVRIASGKAAGRCPAPARDSSLDPC